MYVDGLTFTFTMCSHISCSVSGTVHLVFDFTLFRDLLYAILFYFIRVPVCLLDSSCLFVKAAE